MIGLTVLAAGAGLDEAQLLDLLSRASPAAMLAIFIVALLKRWLLLPRELDACEKRNAELILERDEYKALLFQSLKIGERAVTVAEATKP